MGDRAKELRCNPDDLLDAICLAVTAALASQGMCETIPAEPEQDDNGLYMKLTIPKKNIRIPTDGQKVAVVTGGANGIGKCITEEFRKQGVKVYVIDKAGGDHYIGDISDKAVLEAFAKKVICETGGIDYLINNALPLMKGIDECSYGKVVGGIYDDRFLVKPTKSAVSMMPDAGMELPYEGAKEMLLVDDVENRKFLRKLLESMYDELPAPKKKK
jgi:hypothetical protein